MKTFKKVCGIIALLMFLFAIGFIIYALSHPEASFPWSNDVTYMIYRAYVVIMLVLAAVGLIPPR